MNGLTMDYALTIPALLRRAETFFGHKPIVSRARDKSLHRYTYGECADRVRKLVTALQQLGVRPGDRVATLCWNHHCHLEAYFAIPASGAILHTLNLRLHPDDLAYIVTHAGDAAVIADASLLPLLEPARKRVPALRIIVVNDGAGAPAGMPDGMLDYEVTLAAVGEAAPLPDAVATEYQAAAMCYTTGTTGKPKGVVYSHRAIVLHSLGVALADTFGVRESDIVLPVVPMFHANAWGLPYACAMVGASQIFPGPHLDPASVIELLEQERVTVTAGVPTIWMGILQRLDAERGMHDLTALRCMVIGGAAVPQAMIRSFQERHGLKIVHAWGMTETAPMGTVSVLPSELELASAEEQYASRAMQGRPTPLVEIRARNEDGLVPWNGRTMGELEVRGAWVASAYFNDTSGSTSFTEDGWFRTGDIVTITEHGFIQIQDRSKDLIKSGGEWISSVALEGALMGHPAVAEAAVVGVPHPRWDERPLAAVVLKPEMKATPDELRAFLAPQFAKWWLPDAIEFVPEIPRTSAGKFQKNALRERFKEYKFPDHG